MFGDSSQPRAVGRQAGEQAQGPTDLWTAGRREAEGSSFNLGHYWHLLIKHRYLMAIALAAAIVLGIVATLLMTPVYSASTTLQIDKEAARVLRTDDVTPAESMTESEEFFQTQYGVLRSRSLAQRVIESLGLASSDRFLEQMDVSIPEGRESLASRRANAVLKTVQKNLGVSPIRGSRLVAVSFDSPDPLLSATVANAFAENFIQSNLDRKFQSSAYAREFLENEIAEIKVQLENSERQLVAYAENQRIISLANPDQPESGTQSLAATDLGALNAALGRARAQRIAAEEKARQANSSALLSLPEVLQNPAIQRLAEQRAQLRASYEQKSATFLPEAPEMVELKAQLDETDRQLQSLAGSIRSSVQQQYRVAANEERSLQARVDGLKEDVLDFRGRSIQYNILQREVDTNRALYDALLRRFNEVGVTGGITTNNVSVIDPANPPQRPSKPSLILNLLIAICAGIGFGVAAIFVIEALDETLAAPEDVENKLGLPVLGAVPMLPKGTTPLAALEDVRSPLAEAYYSLRTALQFSTPDGAPALLLVTSSRPGEGKSTTALAIAENFARIGRRTLLIDLDLRNPSMHRLMNVSNDKGMSTVLSGGTEPDEALQKSSGTEGLWFIPSGPLPPNPAELLSGTRIQDFLNRSRDQFDMVVIDGPPVLGFADAPVLAATVAGVVFVVEARSTRRGQARGAIKRLGIGGARLTGIVLTKFDAEKSQSYGGYNYAYDYTYGDRAAPAGRKR